ncbi:hypothetical protein TorRG33x02_022130 [Trema orientale]|uniref:Uncharacterized protein n=1 Tax=Trema orientale TaxID=63057 RepID=A0A2P5FVU2_TREOI|nr:hypothetical protein TorRG33x02_022130 [Trema orientale]
MSSKNSRNIMETSSQAIEKPSKYHRKYVQFQAFFRDHFQRYSSKYNRTFNEICRNARRVFAFLALRHDGFLALQTTSDDGSSHCSSDGDWAEREMRRVSEGSLTDESEAYFLLAPRHSLVVSRSLFLSSLTRTLLLCSLLLATAAAPVVPPHRCYATVIPNFSVVKLRSTCKFIYVAFVSYSRFLVSSSA